MLAFQEMVFSKAVRVILYVHAAKFVAIGLWVARRLLC